MCNICPEQTNVQQGRHRTPRRHILTERQRHTLLALPTDEPSLLKHYTLAEDDVAHIRHRRRPHNRLGFALQLCALRYPERLLSPGEVIPHEVLCFLAMQLVLEADDLLAYASREETRHEHLAILRKTVGTVAVMKGRPVSGVCGEKTLNKRNRGSFCPPRREPRFGFLQDFEDRAPIRIGQVRKGGARTGRRSDNPA